MGLPESIRVKLSSEAAESISLSPVVVQEIPLRELVEHMLGATGKDEQRIREILRRGTLVSGASRFRWEGLEAEISSIRALLAGFPDPDPSRAFNASGCVRAVLRGGRRDIEIPREAVSRRGLFRRDVFWDTLMDIAQRAELVYSGYSYRDRADRYSRALSAEETAAVRAGAGAVKYSTLRDQIHSVAFTHLELIVPR